MKAIQALICVALSGLTVSCATESENELKTEKLVLPSVPYEYSTGSVMPTLGRVLFYDRNLSLNNSVSCSSCHKQNLAFADNVALSKGFGSVLTERNSMPIQNLSGTGGFFPFPGGPINNAGSVLFWDGRETNITSMVMKPVINHVEMGINNIDQLTSKLSKVPYYPALFNDAFGSSEVTTERIAQALAAFVTSISSTQTKLDKSNVGMAELTSLELAGRELFMTTYDCNSCHQVMNPHGYLMAGTFANVGLESVYEDQGLAAITKRPSDAGKFKIPSLRNVALTAPYMHDGRFETLDEVIDHYSEGVKDNPGLDVRLRDANGAPINREIPEQDKKAIIAFLNTLTDHQMITDPRFSNPFTAN
jgi:cytochrome c peroxidase